MSRPDMGQIHEGLPSGDQNANRRGRRGEIERCRRPRDIVFVEHLILCVIAAVGSETAIHKPHGVAGREAGHRRPDRLDLTGGIEPQHHFGQQVAKFTSHDRIRTGFPVGWVHLGSSDANENIVGARKHGPGRVLHCEHFRAAPARQHHGTHALALIHVHSPDPILRSGPLFGEN